MLYCEGLIFNRGENNMKTKCCCLILYLSSIGFLSCQNDNIINKSPDDIINKSPVLSVSVSSITNYKVSFLAKAGPMDVEVFHSLHI